MGRFLLLATLLSLGRASERFYLGPDAFSGNSYARHASALRHQLLHQSLYDARVAPSTGGFIGSSYNAPVGVGLQLRVFKLQSVSIGEARMNMKVWWRTWWTDSRLSWDPGLHGNVTTLQFVGASFASPEESEIWLPELTVYNSIEAIASSLDTTLVTVNYDGSVFWSRPGPLQLSCKFSGLVAFPRDRLRCDFEVGGWALSGATQALYLRDGGVEALEPRPQESVAGTSYQEYHITRVSVNISTFTYGSSTEPWPIARYALYIERLSADYYSTLILVPAVLLTTLSFSVFFMSFEVPANGISPY